MGSATKAGGIEGVAGYKRAVARLEKLKSMLEAARKKLEIIAGRSGSKITRYMSSSATVMPQMVDGVFDDMARKVAANDGEIPESLMARLRSQVKSPFADENDTEKYYEAADAARAVELLARAVKVQERAVAEEKKLAIAALRGTAQEGHAVLARAIVDKFFALVESLRDEDELFDSLRSRDEAIPELLTPSQFPASLRSDPAIRRWISEVLGISEAEVKSRIDNSVEYFRNATAGLRSANEQGKKAAR